jgi:hypothetical protein
LSKCSRTPRGSFGTLELVNSFMGLALYHDKACPGCHAPGAMGPGPT